MKHMQTPAGSTVFGQMKPKLNLDQMGSSVFSHQPGWWTWACRVYFNDNIREGLFVMKVYQAPAKGTVWELATAELSAEQLHWSIWGSAVLQLDIVLLLQYFRTAAAVTFRLPSPYWLGPEAKALQPFQLGSQMGIVVFCPRAQMQEQERYSCNLNRSAWEYIFRSSAHRTALFTSHIFSVFIQHFFYF